MKDIKLKLFTYRGKSSSRRLTLCWEFDVDGEWGVYGHDWFVDALRLPLEDLDYDQQYIRLEFGDKCISQGDLLCIGSRQCYIM